MQSHIYTKSNRKTDISEKKLKLSPNQIKNIFNELFFNNKFNQEQSYYYYDILNYTLKSATEKGISKFTPHEIDNFKNEISVNNKQDALILTSGVLKNNLKNNNTPNNSLTLISLRPLTSLKSEVLFDNFKKIINKLATEGFDSFEEKLNRAKASADYINQQNTQECTNKDFNEQVEFASNQVKKSLDNFKDKFSKTNRFKSKQSCNYIA